MCYVCNCFTWALDILQRALTFLISCWLAYCLCFGMSIAVIAGVAYGYNYCLAEYITLKRHDVHVYMRRGQFYDKPDLRYPIRRMGDVDDVFSSNQNEDYQQEIEPSNEAGLSNQWLKDIETRKYAKKLTKYSGDSKTFDEEIPVERSDVISSSSSIFAYTATSQAIMYSIEELTKYNTMIPIHITVDPKSMFFTKLKQSESSDTVLRLFEPVTETIDSSKNDEIQMLKINEASDHDALRKTMPDSEKRNTVPSLIDLEDRDVSESDQIILKHWRSTLQPTRLKFSTEEDIVYKVI